MALIETVLSSNGYSTNEKQVDMEPFLFKSYIAANAPLTYLFNKISKSTAKNVRIDWTEAEELPLEVIYTGASGETPADATDITITNYTYVKRGDLLFNPRTSELMRISITPTSATAVSVDRGVGGTTATSMNTGDTLLLLGTSYEEGGTYTTARSIVNTNAYNYTQIMNEFVHTSKSTNAEATWFSPKRQENQQKMWLAWQKKVEMTLMFGQRDSATNPESGGGTFRTMGGLHWKLNSGTNYYAPSGGVLSESGFDGFLEDVYTAYPSGKKLALVASPFIIGKINQFAKGKVIVSPNATAYGMKLQQYSGSVDVDLIKHPLLKGNYLRGMAFLIDLDNIKLKWLRTPKMMYNTSVETYDYIEDKIEAEGSLIVAVEKAHGLITGITS